MPKIEDHIAISLVNIRQSHPDIYVQKPEVLEKLVLELHEWLDWFDGKNGRKNGRVYNYQGVDCMKHRERRHHLEGINYARRRFSKKYGAEFDQIVREEAERHVKADMGYVPAQEEYSRLGFWRALRGF